MTATEWTEARRSPKHDLSQFRSVGGRPDGAVRRWLTTTDAGGEHYAAHSDDTRLSGSATFAAWLPRSGVQTYEIDSVIV